MLLNEPLHIIVFPQKNRNFILGLSYAFNSAITPPPVGVIGLAEYVCTHPVLLYSGGSRLHPRERRVGFRPAPSLACG
jgi:hypothetical protein